MSFPLYLLIPLVCAVLYVLGMLMLKRASELGLGFGGRRFWRTGPVRYYFYHGGFGMDGPRLIGWIIGNRR